MPKVFIGLNQGLTKAGEEVVSTMNTVRCNHCSRYISWVRGSLTKGNLMSYILRRLVPSCTLLCIYRAAEQTEQQSNRADCSRAVCRSHDLCSVVTWQPALGWLHCLYVWYSSVSGRHHTLYSNFSLLITRIVIDTLDCRRRDSSKGCYSTLEVGLSYYPSIYKRSRRRNPTFLLLPKLDSDFLSSY
jgi:hypothetical protein